MPGIYRPRHPERTALYRVLFHNFDRFLTVYESRFEKEYGHLRPVVREVVERYLDCGNPRSGFARIRCPDCHGEHLLTFSCKTRGFCPSCHAKRREEWGQWMRETLLLSVPHRQVVLTIPKTLRIFFKYRRRLLGELSRAAVKTLSVYLEALAGEPLVPGIIVAVQTFGDRINFHPHLHLLVTEGGMDRVGAFHRLPHLDDSRLAEIFAREVLRLLVGKGLLSPEWAERILSWRHTGFNVHSRVRARTRTEAERIGKYMVRPILALDRLSFLEREGRIGYRHGDDGAELERMGYLELIARVTSHIPDKGQIMVRYYGLYANAHRGKVRKATRVPVALEMLEEELPRVPSKGWAALAPKRRIGLRSAEMIRKVYEVDPMICPRCGSLAVLMASMSAGG